MRGELLPNAAQMGVWDRAAIETGVSGRTLMERAGRAVADAILADARWRSPLRITVLCGSGNNGGDGYVIARHLAEYGHEVAAAAAARPRAPDAASAADAWRGAVVSLATMDFDATDLIVDCLLGTGLRADVKPELADVIARVNGSGNPVVSVDIPSGIDADTGRVMGEAIRATETLTLASRKPGLLLEPGRTCSGRVRVLDIGLSADACPAGVSVAANAPDVWRHVFPVPTSAGHKYDRGHAVVLSGGPQHTGAARLCAHAALRIGAGLATLVTSARALSVNAAHLTAVMLRVCDEPDELSDLLTDDRFNAVALGPGLGVGEATRDWVRCVLEADRSTVLDADALTSFAGQGNELVSAIGEGREQPVVLTPHDGEFKRLFPEIDTPSRLARAFEAARTSGAIVVLKGSDTVVAAPDGQAVINENATPYLATAGSGDVLTGIVTGLLAQGMPPFEAAAAAVWLHADAAAGFGPGLISEDIADRLPGSLRTLLA